MKFKSTIASLAGLIIWAAILFNCGNSSSNNGSCTDECSSGTKQCSGNGYQTCGNYDSDSCLEWSTVTACGTGETCSNGDCSVACTDECSSGTKQCSGNGYQTCGNYDSDSCLEWGTVTACGSGEACSNGSCAPTCSNECSSGSKECYQFGYRDCGNYDSDVCLEWSGKKTCSVCIDGSCPSSIQAAIDLASAGDTIYVASGTYNENIEIKDDLTIMGEGATWTIIRGTGTDAVVSKSYQNFTKGSTIKRVAIENGTKGIELFSGILKLEQSIVRNNTGYGIYLSSSPTTISNCRISSNSGDGIEAYQSSLTISNNIINSNSGSGIYLISSPASINFNTIVKNGGSFDAGIYCSSSAPTIKNSIVAGHNANNAYGVYNSANISNIDFWNNYRNWCDQGTCYIGSAYYDAVNSILTDPLFVSSTDFHLQTSSPALTASDTGGQIGAYGNSGNPPD